MNRQTAIRLLIIVLLVIAVSALHYTTTIQKPIFMISFVGSITSLSYSVVSGSLSVGARYCHCRFSGLCTARPVAMGDHPGVEVAQYLEILLYNVIGTLTGVLSQRELTQKLRYLKTSIRLEESYENLRGRRINCWRSRNSCVGRIDSPL